MSPTAPPVATVVVELINWPIPVESVVVSFACATGTAILESSLQNEGYGRFSIFACDPIAVFSVGNDTQTCPFRALAKHVAAYPAVAGSTGGLPFVGGWIGFVSYEAGPAIEGLKCTTKRDLPLPLVRFCLYDSVAIYDHRAGQWYLTAVAWPRGTVRRPPVADRLRALRELLATARLKENIPIPTPITEPFTPNMSPRAYFARVERAKRYISAGDIYQVNLTQRFTTRTQASPLALYRRLRRTSPSPHGALLLWDDMAVLSSSPELFLELRDGHVVTRPIKGTRPRGGDRRADAVQRSELIHSEKDRAELTMIIDLLRNDLGRVCSFGSVHVTDADQIEEHPTVFHRVATIEGDLEPRCNWLDLLRATFPGGSVTGAPKIRAMQIIDELEPTARGVYCGSIGWIGLDGSMSMNIAIRTMVQVGDVVHACAGGAIVADSTPAEEYEEIIAKAAGMLRALNCEAPKANYKLRITNYKKEVALPFTNL